MLPVLKKWSVAADLRHWGPRLSFILTRCHPSQTWTQQGLLLHLPLPASMEAPSTPHVLFPPPKAPSCPVSLVISHQSILPLQLGELIHASFGEPSKTGPGDFLACSVLYP